MRPPRQWSSAEFCGWIPSSLDRVWSPATHDGDEVIGCWREASRGRRASGQPLGSQMALSKGER